MYETSKKTSPNWNDFPINPRILKALKDNEFNKPTQIQVKTIKAAIVDKKNVFGAARTGSGKTLAYGISIVNEILRKGRAKSVELKNILSQSHKKQEDFDLTQNETIAIEDMIVDKISEDSVEDLDPTDLIGEDLSCPESIILVPTRELAMQVKEEIDKICKYTKIKCHCIIGGLSQDKQIRQINLFKPEIIIATPGRLYELMQTELVPHLNVHSIASIRSLIIDEADRMVQKGHFEEMLKILAIINETKKSRDVRFPFHVYLFSATLTFLHELPDRLKNGLPKSKTKKSKEPLNIEEPTKKKKILQMIGLLGILKRETRIIDLNDQMSFGRPSSDQLSEYKIHCEVDEKDLYLYYFLTKHQGKRTLIFCNSKDSLRRLTNVLKFLKIDCMKLHSDMDQKKRLQNLERLRQKSGGIMIATDVAARGLDIKDLDCVVHYQVPKTCESYIHRSGRTARQDKTGVTLTLCEPREIHLYKRLCSNINHGRDLEDFEIDFNCKRKLKDLIALAQQCDVLEHQVRSSKSERNWFIKAAKDCDIDIDEDDMRHINGRGKMLKQDTDQDIQKRRKLAAMTKTLNKLLSRPISLK